MAAAAEVWTVDDGGWCSGGDGDVHPRSLCCVVFWCTDAKDVRHLSGYLRVEHIRVQLLSACLSPVVAATAVGIVLRRNEVDSIADIG